MRIGFWPNASLVFRDVAIWSKALGLTVLAYSIAFRGLYGFLSRFDVLVCLKPGLDDVRTIDAYREEEVCCQVPLSKFPS